MIGMPAALALASEPLIASGVRHRHREAVDLLGDGGVDQLRLLLRVVVRRAPDQLDALVLGRLLGALLDHRPERALVAVGDHRDREVRCPASGRPTACRRCRGGRWRGVAAGVVAAEPPHAGRRTERGRARGRPRATCDESLHGWDPLSPSEPVCDRNSMLVATSSDRTAAHRGLRPGDGDVLLEHEPARRTRRRRGRATTSSIARVALPQRPEQARLRRLHERQLAAARSRSASAGVDVLEVDVADALAVLADERHGVDAADQQVAGVEAPRRRRVCASARSTSSAVSTSVPTCGCSTSVSPARRRRGPRAREVRAERVASRPSSSGAARRPLVVLDDGGDEHLGRRRPRPAARRARAALARRRWRGSCSTTGTNPPTSRSPWRSSVARAPRAPSAAGSRAGRARSPCRPSAPSRRGRAPAASCSPQPGTSHTPHEMGAPASRRRPLPPRHPRRSSLRSHSPRLVPLPGG